MRLFLTHKSLRVKSEENQDKCFNKITNINPNLENKIKLLTKRQKECFNYIAKSFTNKMIGYELGITTRTVENHVDAIEEKLNCSYKTKITALIHGAR